MNKKHSAVLERVIKEANFSGNFVAEAAALHLDHLMQEELELEEKYHKLLDFVVQHLEDSVNFYSETVDNYEQIVFDL